MMPDKIRRCHGIDGREEFGERLGLAITGDRLAYIEVFGPALRR